MAIKLRLRSGKFYAKGKDKTDWLQTLAEGSNTLSAVHSNYLPRKQESILPEERNIISIG